MKLNDKIYEYRKIKRWSQEELAEKLEVSRQTVSKWEVGKAIPELDKLIKLSEVFGITVDELVKEEIEIISEEISDKKIIEDEKTEENFNDVKDEESNETIKINAEDNNARKKLKKILLINILIAILVLLAIFTLHIQNRKLQIREIAKIYREEFSKIGISESGFVYEKFSKRENNVITHTTKQYYIYAEENGPKLIKIKEYENDTSKLNKEIYIDISKRKYIDYSEGRLGTYDDVIEINVNDWSYKEYDDYKFVSPIDRITDVFDQKYYGNTRKESERKLSFDFDNDFSIIKNKDVRGTSYFWQFGNRGNDKKEDFFQIQMLLESNWMFCEFDDYKNDFEDSREYTIVQITKLDGNIDDVTIPEL